MRTTHWSPAGLIVVLALLIVITGCGGPKTVVCDSPEATAQRFIEAIRAGDYDLAATGFDYDTAARRQNPDWDTFGESQRNLIVGKLREDKARQLQALSGMLADEVSVGSARMQGQWAIVPVTGAGPLELVLTSRDGLWYIQTVRESSGG